MVDRGTRNRAATSAAVITSAAVSGRRMVEFIGCGSCSCEVGGAIAVTDRDLPESATVFGSTSMWMVVLAPRSTDPPLWRGAGYPGAGDAAAFLAEGVAVVREADLEGQLFTWITAGVVDQLAPYDQGAQGLDVRLAIPPADLQVGECFGVAAVQCDDPAPHP